MRRRTIAVAAVAAVAMLTLLSATPASARRVAIDQPAKYTPCILGQSCAGYTLPSAIDYGNGPQTQLFFYSNGLVSIGSELAIPAGDITSLADFNQDVFTAAYLPGTGTYNSSRFFLDTFPRSTITTLGLYEVPTDSEIEDTTVGFYIDHLSASNGSFTLYLAHSYESALGPTYARQSLAFDPNTIIGYYLNGLLNEAIVGESADELISGTGFTYRFGVPEPHTWFMLILGFGSIGARLRRNRTHGVQKSKVYSAADSF